MGFQFADQYSLLHFASGVIAYFFGLSGVQWFVLHMIFEIVENGVIGMRVINSCMKFWPGGKNYPDAMVNRVGDQVFGMVGWYVAKVLDEISLKRGWFKKNYTTIV